MATFAGNIGSTGATILKVPSARHIFSNFRTICKVGSLIRSCGFKVTQLAIKLDFDLAARLPRLCC